MAPKRKALATATAHGRGGSGRGQGRKADDKGLGAEKLDEAGEPLKKQATLAALLGERFAKKPAAATPATPAVADVIGARADREGTL